MHTEELPLSQIKEDAIMAESSQGPQDTNEEPKQPFVSQEDRPEVRINLDTPLHELRVRDLSAILGFLAGKDPFEDPWKAFWDKDFPEVVKDWQNEKPFKLEKYEKNEKPEKPEKYEKFEKKEAFERFSYTHKKEYVKWKGAKNPETRENRVKKAVEMIAGGKKQRS